jgi:hypothetical protein
VLGAQLLNQLDRRIRCHDTRNAFFAHRASSFGLIRWEKRANRIARSAQQEHYAQKKPNGLSL